MSTPDDIKAKVDALRSDVAERRNGDEETWHVREEDAIYREALEAIRLDDQYASDIAAAALEAQSIEYARWYA